MAALESVSERVQSYLDKHKIASLFEVSRMKDELDYPMSWFG